MSDAGILDYRLKDKHGMPYCHVCGYWRAEGPSFHVGFGYFANRERLCNTCDEWAVRVAAYKAWH